MRGRGQSPQRLGVEVRPGYDVPVSTTTRVGVAMSVFSFSADVRHVASSAAPLPLSAWYAEPLKRTAAAELLRAAHDRVQHFYARGTTCFACLVQELVARHWLGRDVEGYYHTLRATVPAERDLALTDLVYGQLLISLKRAGAMDHLNDGFARAAHYLTARDYFTVLRRHELLACLPTVADQMGSPQGLAALLAEAGVIRRLQGGRCCGIPAGAARCDTVG